MREEESPSLYLRIKFSSSPCMTNPGRLVLFRLKSQPLPIIEFRLNNHQKLHERAGYCKRNTGEEYVSYFVL